MQPLLTQVPPNRLRSIIATFIPVSASRTARDGPAWPVPITIASYLVAIGYLRSGYGCLQFSGFLPAVNVEGMLPKCTAPFQVRLNPSVIPSEVEESLILRITSSKRCLDCPRHDKEPIWTTRP